MMKIMVNGEEHSFGEESLSLRRMMGDLGFNDLHVAIAVNQRVVPKTKWDEMGLNDGDSIEILAPMVGG